VPKIQQKKYLIFMPSNALKPWLFQPRHDPRRQVGRPVGSKNGRPPLTPMRKLVRVAMSRAGNEQHKEGVLGFLTRVANATLSSSFKKP
jgi:hypothetical protein